MTHGAFMITDVSILQQIAFDPVGLFRDFQLKFELDRSEQMRKFLALENGWSEESD